jgi:hypothetical protein
MDRDNLVSRARPPRRFATGPAQPVPTKSAVLPLLRTTGGRSLPDYGSSATAQVENSSYEPTRSSFHGQGQSRVTRPALPVASRPDRRSRSLRNLPSFPYSGRPGAVRFLITDPLPQLRSRTLLMNPLGVHFMDRDNLVSRARPPRRFATGPAQPVPTKSAVLPLLRTTGGRSLPDYGSSATAQVENSSNEPTRGSFHGQGQSRVTRPPSPSLRDRTGAAGPYEICRPSLTQDDGGPFAS